MQRRQGRGITAISLDAIAPPLDLVPLAAKTGFAFIGPRLQPAFPGSPYYQIPLGSPEMREMRRRLRDEGVRVYDIEFATIDEGFVPSSLAPMLESASELGARRLSVCADDPDHVRLVATFAELCEVAAGFGMGVDLECMAWRRVSTFPDAVRVVREAGRPNGGALVDALHLSRTGGSPRDLRGVPPGIVRSAQLCDAPAERPTSADAIIQEARAGRLPPGEGALPLAELPAELPADVTLSVEVPMADAAPADARAQRIFDATQGLLEQCRRTEGGSP